MSKLDCTSVAGAGLGFGLPLLAEQSLKRLSDAQSCMSINLFINYAVVPVVVRQTGSCFLMPSQPELFVACNVLVGLVDSVYGKVYRIWTLEC